MPKQEKLPVWDLSALYKSVDDPKIKSDAKKNLVDAQKFVKRYKNQVAKLDAKQLLAALKLGESILQQTAKLGSFAYLGLTVDSANPKINVLYQQMEDHATQVQSSFIFFDLEIMELPAARLQKFINDPVLKNYKHFLANIAKMKPHHLSEEEEKIFNDKAMTSSGAFNRLFDQHFASKKFKGQPLEAVTKQMNLPDRKARRAAAETFTAGLLEDARMLTLIFNTIIKDKAIGDKWHKFTYPEQARHLSNEVDQKMVETMTEVISRNYKVVEDFYLFVAKVRELPKLKVYDRYAPIAKTDKKYSYEQAKQIILAAFNKFSPEFGRIAKEFFDKNWIHAPVLAGKQGGAYCAGITPDVHPVILVNFQGLNESVQTLAHELGHGINDYLMSKQTLFNYGVPITLAETASVFCEMLVFDDLKEKTTNPQEKFAMYIQKIQGIFATVFRQTAMHKFEQDIHSLQRQKGELTTEEFKALWIKRQNEMFGKSLDNSGSELWWSYIPHFLHTPFYVYGYAFGELLVLSLYAQYKQDPKPFVPKYLEFMSAGSSQSPQELLRPFGINLSDRKFWEGGINIIKEMIVEAKLIYSQIKKNR
ncbi:MAG: M3 family oligoendopeptidase [Candidatus Doudnabacteria bacterium]|nr:M3 family oligoendopeptidase [Candidatus Doudnabacteria bacterium]